MVFFNPAGPLTVNNIPYALGGGRLGNSGIEWSGTKIKAPGNGTANDPNYGFVNASGYGMYYPGGVDLAFSASSEVLRLTAGCALVGTTANSVNGRVQLASHSAFAGGLAFGTLGSGLETIYRGAANLLRTDGELRALKFWGGADVSWQQSATGQVTFSSVANTYARVAALGFSCSAPAGFAQPTGTFTKTTFDTATVTLAQLAERVAAIIQALTLAGTGNNAIL